MIHGIYPRYMPGETVYLKEPYFPIIDGDIMYKFDNWKVSHCHGTPPPDILNIAWKNKLFMPEKYARYFITITWVRIQRLDDISVSDAIAEGLDSEQTFFDKWILINGMESYYKNPYVWVYEFELKEPEDTISAHDLKDIDNAKGIE